MEEHSFQRKSFKWVIVGLLALVLAIWVSQLTMPAIASPENISERQAIFKVGGDLVIPEAQTVEDAFAIGGNLTIEKGTIVEGDAFAIGGTVQLEDDVQIQGDTFAIGGQLIKAESAVIAGNEFTVLEQFSGIFDRFGVVGTVYLVNVVFWAVAFVGAAIAGTLFLLLLPNNIDIIAAALQVKPFQSLLYGIGGVAVLSLLSALTVGSALGSILLPVANIVVLITGLFGSSALCLWLGRKLQKQPSSTHFRPFWTGLILLFIVSIIPFLGGLLISLISLFGFGATLLARYGKGQVAIETTAPSVNRSLERLEHQPE